MKKFLLKLLIFIAPLIVFALVFNPSVIDKEIKQSNGSLNYKEWNDIFQSKINADLIIQGNSRAWTHISPKYIDSVFSINSYNLGMDGYQFHMQYYRFLLYLKHNKKPKYIIQTTDYLTLNKRDDLYMYEQFIPYLDNKEIKEATLQYKCFDSEDFSIPFFKYRHKPNLYIYGLLHLINGTGSSNGKYKGFQAQNKIWDSTFYNFKKLYPKGFETQVDTMTLRLFDKFVTYCQKEGIKLIFVNSPSYFEATKLHRNHNEIDSIYLSYSTKYNIPYLNYQSDSLCLDNKYFFNSQHLNSLGAAKFNVKLANDLKKIIK